MDDWPLTGRLRGGVWQRVCLLVFKTYGRNCWLCGKPGADTVDHVVELVNGGTNALTNLRPAHGRKSTGCPGNYGRSNSKAPRPTWVAPGW